MDRMPMEFLHRLEVRKQAQNFNRVKTIKNSFKNHSVMQNNNLWFAKQ